jgi:hypothetical protein
MAENDGWTLVDVRPYPDFAERHAWWGLYKLIPVDPMARKCLGFVSSTISTACV